MDRLSLAREYAFIGALLVGLTVAASAAAPFQSQPIQAKTPVFSTSASSVRDWIDRLTSSDPEIRASAETTLVEGAERSRPLLRRFLTDPNEDLHAATFEIIRRIGPAAIPTLVELLRDERAAIRGSAVDALIDLAPDTESVQPALRRALTDEESLVARDAARALGALGPKASPSVGALVNALSHWDPHVRIYAAEALASVGPRAAAATTDLVRAIDDRIPGVRWAACEALAGIGPAAASAVPRLIQALGDQYPVRAHLRGRRAWKHRAGGALGAGRAESSRQ